MEVLKCIEVFGGNVNDLSLFYVVIILFGDWLVEILDDSILNCLNDGYCVNFGYEEGYCCVGGFGDFCVQMNDVGFYMVDNVYEVNIVCKYVVEMYGNVCFQ